MSGVLYCGDNLDVLNEYMPASSVDLVYLDPPFNSQRTYNIVYKDSRAQQEAFKDYWSWAESADTYEKLITSGETPKPVRTMLRALHDLLVERDSDQLAYISMMTARLIALHRVLKPTGSLYLHCDPTASHYLKVVLDALFGSENFQNEVIWQRFSSKNDPKRYGRGHDSVLFYSKSDKFCWNPQRSAVQEYSVDKNFTADDNGRRYTLVDLTAGKPGGDVDYEWHGVKPYKGRFWAYSRENMDRMLADGLIVFRRTGMPRLKRYLDEQPGVPLQDVWTDIKLATASKERLGYRITRRTRSMSCFPAPGLQRTAPEKPRNSPPVVPQTVTADADFQRLAERDDVIEAQFPLAVHEARRERGAHRGRLRELRLRQLARVAQHFDSIRALPLL